MTKTLVGRSLNAIRTHSRNGAQRVSYMAQRASGAVLPVAGLGSLSAAAWTLALPAGLAAVGLSCLILDWLVKGE